MSVRQLALIRAAAEALEDGRDPFAAAFLIEHQVTLEEVTWLAHVTAGSLAFWALLAEEDQDVHAGVTAQQEHAAVAATAALLGIDAPGAPGATLEEG